MQWHVMLLLIKLSYKPTSLSDEALKAGEKELKASVPEENINWPDYLKEGWDKFQCHSDDSVCIIHGFPYSSNCSKILLKTVFFNESRAYNK